MSISVIVRSSVADSIPKAYMACLERYAVDQIAGAPKQIGDAIRRQRRKLGLNQPSVRDKTKLRQATISAVESGAPGTQLGTLCGILAALDLEFVIRPRTRQRRPDPRPPCRRSSGD